MKIPPPTQPTWRGQMDRVRESVSDITPLHVFLTIAFGFLVALLAVGCAKPAEQVFVPPPPPTLDIAHADAARATTELVATTQRSKVLIDEGKAKSRETWDLSKMFGGIFDDLNVENALQGAAIRILKDVPAELANAKAERDAEREAHRQEIQNINAKNAKQIEELNAVHAREVAGLEKRATAAEADLHSMTRKVSYWGVAGGIGGIVAGVVLLKLGSLKVGGAVATGGATLFGLSLLVAEVAWMLPYAAGAMLAMIVAAFGYALYVNRKAVRQLVHTGEAAKVLMSATERKKLFGDGPLPGAAFSIQDETTESLVASERKRLSNLAPSASQTGAA